MPLSVRHILLPSQRKQPMRVVSLTTLRRSLSGYIFMRPCKHTHLPDCGEVGVILALLVLECSFFLPYHSQWLSSVFRGVFLHRRIYKIGLTGTASNLLMAWKISYGNLGSAKYPERTITSITSLTICMVLSLLGISSWSGN